MATALQTPKATAAGWWDRWWPYVLDFFLTLWVLRAPVGTLLFGFLLLWFAPQAQDLLVELATPGAVNGWARIGEFYFLLLFIWAMPTHYASRLLVDTDERYRARIVERDTAFINNLQKWTPRVLGALTFVVMLGAAWWSREILPDVTAAAYNRATLSWHLALVAVGIAASLVIFLLYTAWRENLAGIRAVDGLEILLEAPMAALRRWVPRLTSGARSGSESDLGPFLLLLMFVGFALAPIAFPLAFAQAFPRAMVVPFVIGGWLPLLAYLAGLGRRLRAPLITVGVALLTILPIFLGDNYPVRTIDSVKAIDEITHVSGARNTAGVVLPNAVTLWKRANQCEKTECPRPIIVAAAGGASRAGFFTAGVVGQLLDDQLRLAGKGHGLTPQQMTNRIFALSTVSGSSVGAVMTVAALAASDGGKQPCRDVNDPFWHGEKIADWRSCLEALMSGDFLTPVFTGFVFHDTFNVISKLVHSVFSPFEGRDRAAILEESFELRFKDLIGARDAGQSGLRCRGDLNCPFMTLIPTKERWLPLLLLNGTSVGSGQRVITTALNWYYEKSDSKPCTINLGDLVCQIFQRSWIFHGLLLGDKPLQFDDVRLSTAAHNSARFPLISPPGEVHDSDGTLVDRIVDGGYFENFGAQTAAELAQALITIDPNLQPFILVLSNDPTVAPKQPGKSQVKAARATDASWLTDVSGPIKAFANTRDAHGTLAVDDAELTLNRLEGLTHCNLSYIRVWAEPSLKDSSKARELSMSWWLSKPVQIYLHEQTEFTGPDQSGQWEPKNKHSNEPRIRYLLDALAKRQIGPVKRDGNPCPQE